MVRQNCENCDEKTIKEIVDQLEQKLGLLDAAFAYLCIMYPTNDKKNKARDAVDALSKQWRDIGLSISLKAPVMEVHLVIRKNLYKAGTSDRFKRKSALLWV